LKKVVQLYVCPDTDGKVAVRVSHDPRDTRGPNEESTCRVKYVIRCQREGSYEWEVAEEEGQRGAPLFEFIQACGQTLPCIDKGVQQMRRGGRAVISAPKEWAYGAPGYVPSPAKREIAERYKDCRVEVELELTEVDRFKANYSMAVDEKVKTQIKRKEQGNALFK